ncbi:MAG: hypothetical protein ACE5H5_02515 [Nitrospinota bacterium]
MKITTVRDFRNKATAYLKAEEPVLITRHGRVAGLLLPLQDPEHLPVDLRRELLARFGEYLSKSLEARGISEKEILEDFEASRKTRRRR